MAKTQSTIKKKVGDNSMTIKQYAAMTGASKRLKFWLNKKYDSKEMRTGDEWFNELVEQGAVSEKPAILDQMVPASK